MEAEEVFLAFLEALLEAETCNANVTAMVSFAQIDLSGTLLGVAIFYSSSGKLHLQQEGFVVLVETWRAPGKVFSCLMEK